MAVICCQNQQNGEAVNPKGNQKANRASKQATFLGELLLEGHQLPHFQDPLI